MKEFNKSYTGLRLDLITEIEGAKNTVLDVGCATGMTGDYLLEQKIASKIYGIELDIEMAKKASEIYHKVFQGDLNDDLFVQKITTESPKFDFIIFGDILEHLVNPTFVLTEFAEKNLEKKGKIIISLPNIGHIETFIQIYLKGTFPKNERGIFDKTHLRWFTKRDAEEMISECGLQILKTHRNFRSRDRLGSKFSTLYRLIRGVNQDWVTFQFVFTCSKV